MYILASSLCKLAFLLEWIGHELSVFELIAVAMMKKPASVVKVEKADFEGELGGFGG